MVEDGQTGGDVLGELGEGNGRYLRVVRVASCYGRGEEIEAALTACVSRKWAERGLGLRAV
jgi:hypothetical protein